MTFLKAKIQSRERALLEIQEQDADTNIVAKAKLVHTDAACRHTSAKEKTAQTMEGQQRPTECLFCKGEHPLSKCPI